MGGHLRPDSRSSTALPISNTRTHHDPARETSGWGLASPHRDNCSQGWLLGSKCGSARGSRGAALDLSSILPSSCSCHQPPGSAPRSPPLVSANSNPRLLSTAPNPFHTPTFREPVGCRTLSGAAGFAWCSVFLVGGATRHSRWPGPPTLPGSPALFLRSSTSQPPRGSAGAAVKARFAGPREGSPGERPCSAHRLEGPGRASEALCWPRARRRSPRPAVAATRLSFQLRLLRAACQKPPPLQLPPPPGEEQQQQRRPRARGGNKPNHSAYNCWGVPL